MKYIANKYTKNPHHLVSHLKIVASLKHLFQDKYLLLHELQTAVDNTTGLASQSCFFVKHFAVNFNQI